MDRNIMRDFGRINLVTSFVCTECGKNLTLGIDDYGNQTPTPAASTDCGITGAYCLQNKIYVHPCQSCIDKVLAPAKAMAAAIATLQK